MASDAVERDLLQHCHTVFAGPNAFIRRQKPIERLIRQNQAVFQPLLRKHGRNSVMFCCQSLLKRGAFKSSSNGKANSTKSSETLATRRVQRTVAEEQAARSEDQALAEAAREGDRYDGGEGNVGTSIDEAHGSASRAPNPFPIYLPFPTQHRIMTATQSLLEQVCFDFTMKWLPDVLSGKQRTCPEAMELHKWTKIMTRNRSRLPKKALDNSQGPLRDSELTVMDQLRHAAVHRIPLTAARVQQMVLSAGKLAAAFRDTARATKIELLHREISKAVEDLKQTKGLLESLLDADLKAIDVQREKVISTMVRDNAKYETSVSALLDLAVADMAADH